MNPLDLALRVAVSEAHSMGLDAADYIKDPRVHDFLQLVMNSWLEYGEESSVISNSYKKNRTE